MIETTLLTMTTLCFIIATSNIVIAKIFNNNSATYKLIKNINKKQYIFRNY